MFDDISFLVQETFKDVEKSKKGGFLSHFLGQEEELAPESSGVFYKLELKAATYVVRIFASDNLQRDLKNIKKHPDMYPTLRLTEEDLISGRLQFFVCDGLKLAESLKANLANKRFPLFEENVFNVSDPGDSWWLNVEESSLKIYFKLSRTENMSRLIKLGPLGEGRRYSELFVQLRGYFQKLFPVSDYACGNGQISMSCLDPQNNNFYSLIQLFKHGELNSDLFEFLRRWESDPASANFRDSIQKANYTMVELATMRRFWLDIQEQIDTSVAQ